MTAAISPVTTIRSGRPLKLTTPIRPGTDTRPVVAVIAEDDVFDAALLALVRGLGFDALLLDLDDEPPAITADQHPVASIVRTLRRIPQLRQRPHTRMSTVIAIGDIDVRDGNLRPDVRLGQRCSGEQLQAVLAPLFPSADAEVVAPVHVTPRELEVLTTYISGATMSTTAKHHFIAESTVRAHYRRVSDRYAHAGRRVDNKTQLLLALIADGLVDPSALLDTTRPDGPRATALRPVRPGRRS